MARLGIKGDKLKAHEVIEILEMLGGKNKVSSDGTKWFCGYDDRYYYTLEDDNNISICYVHNYQKASEYVTYTLEQFKRKFPYKVGDVVLLKNGIITAIYKMEFKDYNVIYHSKNIWDHYRDLTTEDIKRCIPNKEQNEKDETMGQELTDKITHIDINNREYADKVEICLDKHYEYKITEDKLFIIRRKSKYPMQFADCCKVLKINPNISFVYENSDVERGNTYLSNEKELFNEMLKLRVCLLAYWKIAGDWKPDWTDNNMKKFTISYYQDKITLSSGPNVYRLLAFPTEEMRDEFYYNFKDLIEKCKKLI